MLVTCDSACSRFHRFAFSSKTQQVFFFSFFSHLLVVVSRLKPRGLCLGWTKSAEIIFHIPLFPFFFFRCFFFFFFCLFFCFALCFVVLAHCVRHCRLPAKACSCQTAHVFELGLFSFFFFAHEISFTRFYSEEKKKKKKKNDLDWVWVLCFGVLCCF
jgi:hypothetical protein